ncbi:MAG: peptidylprolyl isomerase [Nitrosomonadales bacterium]|nr:peptidylprolyl isomerase [Nitrosomonadales bacterium]
MESSITGNPQNHASRHCNARLQTRSGADFAEYAKKYSDDRGSAEQGGDMGYLHGGMLAGSAAEAVSKLKVGEISEPSLLLEGVGVFKLIDRKDAKLNTFDAVKGRATELLINEEAERAWKDLIAQLRKKTSITVDESHFEPLPVATKAEEKK